MVAILSKWEHKWLLTRKGSLSSKVFNTHTEALAFARKQGWRVMMRVK